MFPPLQISVARPVAIEAAIYLIFISAAFLCMFLVILADNAN